MRKDVWNCKTACRLPSEIFFSRGTGQRFRQDSNDPYLQNVMFNGYLKHFSRHHHERSRTLVSGSSINWVSLIYTSMNFSFRKLSRPLLPLIWLALDTLPHSKSLISHACVPWKNNSSIIWPMAMPVAVGPTHTVRIYLTRYLEHVLRQDGSPVFNCFFRHRKSKRKRALMKKVSKSI